jgi:hypothetical protein
MALKQRDKYCVTMVIRYALSVFKNDMGFVENLLLACIGLGGQCTSRVLLYACSSDVGETAVRGMLAKGWFARGLETLQKLGKIVHTTSRSMGVVWVPELGLTGDEYVKSVDKVLYLDQLVGRFDFVDINLNEGIEQRRRPNPCKALPTRDGMSKHLFEERFLHYRNLDIKSLVESTSSNSRNLEEQMERYPVMASSGACKRLRGKLSIRWKDKDYVVEAPTKLAWIADLTPEDVVEVVYSLPKIGIETRGVRKTEPGKLRMLLPGPEAMWLCDTLALLDSEDHLFSGLEDVVLQYDAMEGLLQMLDCMEWSDGGGCVFAEDFDDFNILHDINVMSSDLRQYGSTLLRNYGYKGVMIRKDTPMPVVAGVCALLSADAMYKLSACEDGQRERWVHLVRGLWTGWRTTMFFNTRYNRLYSKVVNYGVEQYYGFKPLEKSYYVGDDSISRTDTEYEALRRLEAFNLCGLASQSTKQSVDSDIAELTRIVYRDGDKMCGSLLRAINWGSSGDMQTPVLQCGSHMAGGIRDQLRMWVRRGFREDRAEELFRFATAHWAKWTFKHKGKEYRVPVPRQVMAGSERTGGLGCPSLFGEGLEMVPALGPLDQQAEQQIRYAGKHWKARNADVIQNRFNRRMYDLGLNAPNQMVERQLKESIVKSQLPYTLARQYRRGLNYFEYARYSAWLERGGQVRKQEIPVSAHDYNSLYRHGVVTIENLTKQIRERGKHRPYNHWLSNWSLADAAATTALGNAAGAPAVLRALRVRRKNEKYDVECPSVERERGRTLKRSEAIAKLSENQSNGYLKRLQEQAGTLRNLYLDEEICKPMSTGRVAGKHLVLVDLALESMAVAWHNNMGMMYDSDYEITIAALARDIESYVADHNYWGGQMTY